MCIYLESFKFPCAEEEFGLYYRQPSVYNNFYPAGVLADKLKRVEFAPVTIFYGGNGSGKSTALNLIAENLDIIRTTPYNKSTYFYDYAKKLCSAQTYNFTLCKKIITSDDVFKGIFTTRLRNEQIDERREELFEKRDELFWQTFAQYSEGKNLINRYDEIREMNEAKKMTKNRFVKARAEANIIGKSNGETALEFFIHELREEGLYLLDEPENSLSAPFQLELSKFLYEAARFFNCQLVIATHSPFVLSIPGAKIYNLDTCPSQETSDWTNLENMKIYYEFFKTFKNKFE